MAETTIRVYQLFSNQERRELEFPGEGSLDAITDRLPKGYYTTFRTFEGRRRVLGFQAHLARLYQPDIRPCLPEPALRVHIRQILRQFNREVRLRIVFSRTGEIYSLLHPFRPVPKEVYEKGVGVVTTELERNAPHLKSTGFIASSGEIRQQLLASGVFEALMVRGNCILEGVTSNFFYIEKGRLGTAQHDVLQGVTRRTILHLARENGIPILYGALNQDRTASITEAFITSSSRGIVPVVKIDGIPVGQGRPGAVTRELMQSYQDHVSRFAEEI